MTQKTKNIFLNEPIKLFLDMCLWEKGIRESEAAIRADMIAELAGDFEEFLLQAIFEKLDPQYLPEWKALMESDVSPESVMAFFKEKIPNFDALVENAMGQFKDIYVGAASNN